VGISPALGEISKGLVERVGSLPLAFHPFHSPGISTAFFRWSPVLAVSVARPLAVDYGSPVSFFLLLFFSR